MPKTGSLGSRLPRKRATIQDVAEHAGVSIATVSRVLNRADSVDAGLAERVRSAMGELQYQPSGAARTLAGRLSTIIGLLVIDMQNPFYMELIRGVEDVAQRNGYLVVLCNSAEDPRKEQQYIEVLRAEPVAGAIVVPTSDRKPVIRRFVERGIPVVSVDRRVLDGSTDTVLIDNVAAAREAVRHLLDNGYRRIGLITGPDGATTARDRTEGYRQALRKAGIEPDSQWERSGPYSEESARRLAGELLDLDPPIDALFTGNNRLTMGALQLLYERGLRIPEDVALACFDEVPWAHPGAISLTSVIQPAYELGSTAATRLIHRLQHGGQLARQEIVLAHQLRIGDSSRSRVYIGAPVAG
ncbi:MAG TPA: LacI family DNA-binding transcriptional regulator [Chloroflexota bacterium]|nr:LacI family DNA-binding transcriptional regulator [Chloroflexota bacterium]